MRVASPSAGGEDARLYLELLGVTQVGLQVEARSWFFRECSANSYSELVDRYPEGSREADLLFNLLGFFESVGMLISRGLMHEDVFFDAPFGFDIVWKRIGKIAIEWNKATEPPTWENLIWLGKRYDIWNRYVWKPKLDTVPPDRAVRRRVA
jgi:hypothetical protein